MLIHGVQDVSAQTIVLKYSHAGVNIVLRSSSSIHSMLMYLSHTLTQKECKCLPYIVLMCFLEVQRYHEIVCTRLVAGLFHCVL